MPDPELEMGGGGGSFRPRGERSQKNSLTSLWASVWSKNEGGGLWVLPLDMPLISDHKKCQDCVHLLGKVPNFFDKGDFFWYFRHCMRTLNMRSGSLQLQEWLLYFDEFGCGLIHGYYFCIVHFLYVSHEVKMLFKFQFFLMILLVLNAPYPFTTINNNV